MDFFEKAHVLKKDSSRRESKSEEAMKKQLKQMLYGYKQSDSKLIKSCDDSFDAHKYNEDSSSVSGFSDLNITNSSNDADTTQKSTSIDNEDESVSVSDGKCVNADSTNDANISSDFGEDSINNIESSDGEECSSKIDTLSDNLSHDLSLNSPSGSESVSISSLSESVSDVDTDNSDFDADGELAMKIMEKLGKKGITKKKGKKRKLEQKIAEESTVSDICNEQNFENKRLPKKTEIVMESCGTNDESESYMSDSNSSVFVSVNASKMPNQSLSELLGEYKHPTVKNLPSDIQNSYTTNSDMFFTEDMTVEDIPLQEIDSLTPETECNLTASDIESAGVDESNEVLNDSRDTYNNTSPEEMSDYEITDEILGNDLLNSIQIYYGTHSCICVLKHPAELYVHGKLTIKALGGTVEVFGYRLQSEPCELYAPNYNHALSIKTIANQNLYNGLFSKLTSEGLKVYEAEDIVTTINEYDCIISLRKLNKHNMKFVESNMTIDIFSKTSKHVDNILRMASEKISCSLYMTRPWKTFEEGSWGNAVECGLSKYILTTTVIRI
jgi:hypothetical protein